MAGQKVCRAHGGASASARAKGQRVVQAEKATKLSNGLGLARDIDPHTALLEELHRTAGVVAWISHRVADLDPEGIIWGLQERQHGFEKDFMTDLTTEGVGLHMWVQLWHKERQHLLNVSKACISAGIEERRVRLAEQEGQMLAQVLRAVLDRLELTPAQRKLVSEVVPQELRRAELQVA